LGRLEDDRGFLSVVLALKDEDKSVRHNAILAVSHFKQHPILPLVIEALQDNDEWVRRAAVSILSFTSFLERNRRLQLSWMFARILMVKSALVSSSRSADIVK